MTARQDQVDHARTTPIEDVLARRGIELRGGAERCGPCPVCGGVDRFSINTRKQLWNCRGCRAGGDAISLVRHLDGVSFHEAVASLTGESTNRNIGKQRQVVTKTEENNSHKAAWLWATRRPITEDCPAALYLRSTRNYHGPIPATLGFLPANGTHPPAMIAAFGFCEEREPGVLAPPIDSCAVHITRLTPDGRKLPDRAKTMHGPMSGLPIVLAPPNDLLGLTITEGIEDGLSVFEQTGLGVWAAGSAGNMPKIAAALPSYVECVTVCAHRDEAGLRGAKEAVSLIKARGIEVHLKGLRND